MREIDDKVKDGLSQLDRVDVQSPTKEDIIALIQKTKRKQRREAILFFIVTLILVNIVVFSIARLPAIYVTMNIILIGLLPVLLVLGLVKRWRDRYE
ncbi:YxlC family protein [Shouchella lehensis]|uniref:YxlC family protein n=1 Tax=Shouchella lehensis TaxID=300825 RepID=A0A4Y7WHR9_9BACI|nr:YxlC family protein [Shouchella lehensis]MBG9782591.1 hypothetical protein [Shouchella lehensis]TES47794.1 hypothetical protein E2L03_11560 [Shouchella lehensis]